MLLDIPGVADDQVGDVRTMDNYSFIVVDPAVEDAVIAALNGYDLKGRTLAVNRARKRGEPAPAREPRPMDSIGDEPVESPSDGSRITSYNVCYTKLLRKVRGTTCRLRGPRAVRRRCSPKARGSR